nr:RidA family protein [Burkholderia territorii]
MLCSHSAATDGRRAAEFVVLNVLAQIGRRLGGLNRLHHLVRVNGQVASADRFQGQPAVINGTSAPFANVRVNKAGHSRSAFPHRQLPADATVILS